MMQVNRFKGVVERYAGEVDGKDHWQTVYDPAKDDVSKLELVIEDIRREERERAAQKLTELINRHFYAS